MLYFVVLTHSCNLKCTYCGYGENDDDDANAGEVRYAVEDLGRFLAKDPEPSIIFYGGEPLTRVSLMKEIMDKVPCRSFMLQTNGLRLKDLDSDYLTKFSSLLISIDGRKETTDHYRGEKVYNQILENVRAISKKNYQGDVIARMTVSEKTDIFLDAMHLAELNDPKFNHIHWQIDALWDYPPELRWKGFDQWMGKSYRPGIVKLVRNWGKLVIEQRRILPFVPFTGVMRTLLDDEAVGLRCGAGINSFAVSTSGDLTVCPIAPEWSFAKVGNIYESDPMDLPNRVVIGGLCARCVMLALCGGRCLFTNKTMLWGETGFQKVCEPTKTMIVELTKLKPAIIDMISKSAIPKDAFNYAPYNNGCEVIP